MRSFRGAWVIAAGLLLWAGGCGSDDDTGLGTGGAAGSAGSAGSGGSAGTATGGSAGASAGGTAGAGTGGSAGAGTGGSAGAGTGGSAGAGTGGSAGSGTGGSAGSGTGGSAGAGGDCPATEPTQDAPCDSLGQVCCYAPDPARPWRCVPTNPDGGGPYAWVKLNSRVCCPASPPQIGAVCNTPGDLECCYGAPQGFACNMQPSPDVWAAASCN